MILAFSGYAGSGKDTLAEELLDRFGFGRVAFADKLKDLAWAINPMVGGTFRLQDYKDRYWPQEDLDPIEVVDRAKAHPEVRRFLQDLGAAMRDEVSPSFWINQALRSIETLQEEDGFTNVVVTDVRYPNELSALKSWAEGAGQEFLFAHVARPGVGPKNDHESEHNVDALAGKAGFIIMNDAAPREVIDKVYKHFKGNL